MSEEFIKVLDHLCDKLGVAIDWSSENILPYAQQVMEKFIVHELWTSVAVTVVWAIALVICAIITHIARQKAIEDGWDWKTDSYDIAWVCIIVTIVCGAILICVACYQTFDIIACLTFPEKLIFDLVTNMK